MSDDGAGFGALLRACRRAAGLSQDELAERSGLTAHTISELERGRTRSPHRDSVQRLAGALELGDRARAEFLAAAGRRLAPVATSSAQTAAGQSGEPSRTSGRITPQQLPAATRHFTGRERELDELLALAETSRDGADTGAGAGAVVICAVDGMGGVGKTALAVQAAHRLRDQFPDGQLMIDLHGYTAELEPLSSGDALDRLLLALGVQPERIPQDLDARAAFYRDRLAGTRTLIVLDNAAGTAQIRPLLPGAAGCLVLEPGSPQSENSRPESEISRSPSIMASAIPPASRVSASVMASRSAMWAHGLFLRIRLRSMMSSCTTEAECTSSMAAAALTIASESGCPAARQPQ